MKVELKTKSVAARLATSPERAGPHRPIAAMQISTTLVVVSIVVVMLIVAMAARRQRSAHRLMCPRCKAAGSRHVTVGLSGKEVGATIYELWVTAGVANLANTAAADVVARCRRCDAEWLIRDTQPARRRG